MPRTPRAALPARLQATLELVPHGITSVADIGSGHGALAAALAGRGVHVVATERTSGSFASLRHDLCHLGYAGQIDLRLGDGLAALRPGEVEVVVIAGLGGRSVMRILGRAAWLPPRLVLQPMQDAHLLGAWLAARGWAFEERRMVQGRRWYLGWLVDVPAADRAVN
ncbi:MAG: tRNA (adenine(22)-N(1))-methyltransferase TrmK [Candidatus Dormibacteria bacterium]